MEAALVRTLQWYGLKFCFSLNLLKNAEALQRVQRTTKQGALIGWTNIKGSVSKAFSHQRDENGETQYSAQQPLLWKCAGWYRKKTFLKLQTKRRPCLQKPEPVRTRKSISDQDLPDFLRLEDSKYCTISEYFFFFCSIISFKKHDSVCEHRVSPEAPHHHLPPHSTMPPPGRSPAPGVGGGAGESGALGAPHHLRGTAAPRKIRSGSELLIPRRKPPSFLPQALFEATETAPAPLTPGPLPVCCSCASPLPPPGFPVRLFLPRVSLPLRFPPAGFGLGLLPGPGGGQRPPLQPGRAAARGPTRGGLPRAPRGSNNNNNQQNPQTTTNNNKKEAKNWKPLLSC